TTEPSHVGRHEHVRHARGAPGSFGVDLQDARMGVWAPVHGDEQHAGQRQVGDISTAARHEPRILPPADLCAEQPLAHVIGRTAPASQAPSPAFAQIADRISESPSSGAPAGPPLALACTTREEDSTRRPGDRVIATASVSAGTGARDGATVYV